MTENKITFTRVKSDVNGNPRYVCHFLSVLPQSVIDAPVIAPWNKKDDGLTLMQKYQQAIKLANSIGGRKFDNKQYGGGLVFQSYNLDQLVQHINRVTGQNFTGYQLHD